MRIRTALVAVAMLAGIAASTHAATVTITRDKWGVPQSSFHPASAARPRS